MDGLRVTCEIKGLGMEKLLNEARKAGLSLGAVRRLPGRAVRLRCAAGDYAALKALAEGKGFSVGPARPVGALRGAVWLKKRWGLAAGAALCLGLMIWAMGYVWQVRIENAGSYAGEVRAFLQERGIFPGVRRSRVHLDQVRDALEWYLPRVQWVRAEWRGVGLRVTLEEGAPPPEKEDGAQGGSVVAARDGLVTQIVTYAGTPLVKPGDFVRAGQTLIAGEEKAANGEKRAVRPRGEVTARVWEAARAAIPLTEWRSLPTGREEERRVIETPFFSWASGSGPDYLTADREVSLLPVGGAWVPVWMRRESIREAALEKTPRDREEALREAEALALFRLREKLKITETVDKWINFRMIEGDTIVVEAAGEMLTAIGRYQKSTP